MGAPSDGQSRPCGRGKEKGKARKNEKRTTQTEDSRNEKRTTPKGKAGKNEKGKTKNEKGKPQKEKGKRQICIDESLISLNRVIALKLEFYLWLVILVRR